MHTMGVSHAYSLRHRDLELTVSDNHPCTLHRIGNVQIEKGGCKAPFSPLIVLFDGFYDGPTFVR